MWKRILATGVALALGSVLALGAASAAFAMTMYIEIAGAETLTLEVEGSDSVQQVKHMIADETGNAVEDQVLTFEGNPLADGRTLADYRIVDGSTLVLLLTPTWLDHELATPIINEAYSDSVSASGGDINYAVTAGSLPLGLTLDAQTGAVSGSATASGAYAFTASASNVAGTIEQRFEGEIAPAAIVPTPDPEPEPEPEPAPAPAPAPVPVPDHGAQLAETGAPSPVPLLLAAAIALFVGVFALTATALVSRPRSR